MDTSIKLLIEIFVFINETKIKHGTASVIPRRVISWTLYSKPALTQINPIKLKTKTVFQLIFELLYTLNILSFTPYK